MQEILKQIHLYLENSETSFSEISQSQLPPFVDEIRKKTASLYSLCEIKNDAEAVLFQLIFSYRNDEMPGFLASYRSVLYVSKIAKAYYWEHSFTVDDSDPNKTISSFSDLWGVAWTKSQFATAEIADTVLAKNGYQELSPKELSIIVSNDAYLKSNSFYSPMTVQKALFGVENDAGSISESKELLELIRRIYVKKDYAFFTENCKQTPTFTEEIRLATTQFCERLEIDNSAKLPDLRLFFSYLPFEDRKLHVEYRSELRISKVGKVFYWIHEFEIANAGKDAIEPTLWGYSNHGVIRQQILTAEAANAVLVESEFHELNDSQLNSVIPNIPMPQNELFGSQMTLEFALFYDLYGLCDDL